MIKCEDYNFTRRELKALPFIIYESAVSLDGVRKILRQLDFDNTRHIGGLVNVYLNQYDDSTKTEHLRGRLLYMPARLTENSRRLKKIFAAREFLFGDERLANTAKLFAQRQSVAVVLEDLGLADSFKVSNFIQAALKNFYRTPDLAAQMKILQELDADFDAYKSIFPAVADALIPTVDRAGIVAYKNTCLNIFYHRLGDPRFGFTRFKWNGVSAKAVDIFSHWLSANDLELFFSLIRQTAVDRMWRYREKFWRAYLPYITKTKIFLGTAAQIRAAQAKSKVQLNHGDLKSSDETQSVFVFQIGEYIFSEWSHNGKLRVHRVNRTESLFDIDESLFERNRVNRNVLVEKFVDEWIHSSPRTYFWQLKVSDWLRQECGIDKTQKDWGLTD